MPEFSIIVPVYRVEKYLNKCVDSVLCQTFEDFELILVDDGSPDNCGKICDSYESADSRIKVVHKENGGLSSARNAGLDIAIGKYIIFLDSDDFWKDNDALQNICSNLTETNADVLIFLAQRYYEETGNTTDILNSKSNRNNVIDCDKYSAISYMIQNNIYKAAAWNKVVKKTLIDNHNMRFKEGRLSEDMDWCGDLLVYSQSFDLYNKAFYQYRQQRVGSITRANNKKLIEDKLYMCEKGLSQSNAIKDINLSTLVASYYAYEYTVLLGVSSAIKETELIERMKKLKGIIQYDISRKVRKVKALMDFFGFNMTRRILCLYVRVKK